jgi:hypothetical protein
MERKFRRPSAAMVVACLALFVASTGTSIAASHYLITSTKQIKPSVLAKLKGAKGLTGAQGTAGAAGAQGTQGLKGDTGATGPSDAWEASSPETTNATSTPTALSVTVPAGSYDVTGKAQEQNRDTTLSAALSCSLSAGATLLDSTYSTALPWSGGTYGYGDAVNVVHGSYTTSTGTTFNLSCIGSNGATAMYVNRPTLSAIKVGTLH